MFFYKRLTLGILRRKTLVSLFWMCAISYAVLCLTITLSCSPYVLSHRHDETPGNC